MNQSTVLAVENLSFSYPERPDVLAGIDFRLQKGERVALIGPNGSGKTTLFMLMCGILKPRTGKITANGNTVHHNRFNPEISYLFQTPDDQLFNSTVFDDVAFGPLNMSLSKTEVKQRATEAIRMVGCEAIIDRPPFHLSGGEKRMAAIATILSMMPEIVLFDEPTSNLDSRNRRRIIKIMSEMDHSMIVSSHDLEFLLETCNRVLLLDQGELIIEGPIREVLSEESLLNKHGLEKPHSLTPHMHS